MVQSISHRDLIAHRIVAHRCQVVQSIFNLNPTVQHVISKRRAMATLVHNGLDVTHRIVNRRGEIPECILGRHVPMQRIIAEGGGVVASIGLSNHVPDSIVSGCGHVA